MNYELPKLPFGINELEPHISKETLEFHYGKHHKSYVDKLNNLTEGTEFSSSSLEDVVKNSSGGIFNNAAQIWNHNFYWQSLSPKGGGQPTGEIATQIDKAFGSFEEFKKEFSNSAATLFGSGWVYLVSEQGSLKIKQYKNADCPLTDGVTPILTWDVWEHAYYIDYRNARPKYTESFWKLVNWEFANSNI